VVDAESLTAEGLVVEDEVEVIVEGARVVPGGAEPE